MNVKEQKMSMSPCLFPSYSIINAMALLPIEVYGSMPHLIEVYGSMPLLIDFGELKIHCGFIKTS